MGSNQLVRTKSQSLRDRGDPPREKGHKRGGGAVVPVPSELLGGLPELKGRLVHETRVKAINE